LARIAAKKHWQKREKRFFFDRLEMRIRVDLALLILLTVLLAFSLVYVLKPSEFRYWFSNPDYVHPRPVVELAARCESEVLVVVGNRSISCPYNRSLDLKIKLVNNSSEPSAREDFAAGFLIILSGARVGGLKLGSFDGVIGIGEGGQLIDPINSTMLEFFTKSLEPWESKSAEISLVRDPSASCIEIAYRGWIIDEDDVVRNPVSGDKERYIARFPPENELTNPPDSRWAGKEFLRYETYVVEICS